MLMTVMLLLDKASTDEFLERIAQKVVELLVARFEPKNFNSR